MYLTLGWIGDCDRTVQIDKDHLLFEDCVRYTEEEIEEISKTGTDEELILALRSCLRYNVARIAGKWESTIPFIDDMVNEGMLALVEWVPKRHYTDSKHSVMKRATSTIVNSIELFLNSNQSLAAASRTEQRRRISKGEPPIYLQSVTNDMTLCDKEEKDPDTYKRDVMEALDALVLEDEIDKAIVRKENWSRTNTEMAKELGVPIRTVSYRRARLYNQYLELTR